MKKILLSVFSLFSMLTISAQQEIVWEKSVGGEIAGAVIGSAFRSLISIGTGTGVLVGGLIGAVYLGSKGSDAGGAIVEEIYK